MSFSAYSFLGRSNIKSWLLLISIMTSLWICDSKLGSWLISPVIRYDILVLIFFPEEEVFCFHATLSPSTEGYPAVRYGSHVLVAEGGGWWRRAQQWTRQCRHNVVCQEVRVWTDGCEKFVSHKKMEQRKEREVWRKRKLPSMKCQCVYSNWRTGHYTKKASAKMDF